MATPKKAAPAAPAAAEPAAGKKKGKLIPILAAVLLLSGGGAGGWYYMKQQNAEAKTAQPKPEKKKPPVFVPLDTFTVNLSSAAIDHFLQVAVTLEVSSAEVQEQVKSNMPVIRSRVLMLLASKTAEELSNTAGKQKLMTELLAETRAPLPQGESPTKGIENVHFSNFIIQ